MSLEIALVSLLVIVSTLVAHRSMRRGMTVGVAQPSSLKRYPSITIIRPIRGLDVDIAGNLEEALTTGYPGDVETLFVFDDAADPAYAVAERVVRCHVERGRPGRAEVLVAGEPPLGLTGKLHAMAFGVRHARGELLAFCDSDTRPDRELLRELVEVLETTPDAGDTFAPVLVGAPARSAGDVGYALLINAWYGPAVARVAGPTGDLPFIMGQLMVFRRQTLSAIGGVECAAGQLVDDMWIGHCVRRAGLRNVMIRRRLSIVTGGMSLSDFVRLFRRWLLFSRNGLPSGFAGANWLRGVQVFAAMLCLVVAPYGTARWAIAPAMAAVVVWMASQLGLQRAFGGAPVPLRYAWVVLLVPLIAPVLFLSTILYPRVTWRGRSYALEPSARLAEGGAGSTFSVRARLGSPQT
jgi:ceramide glucosyltransferase